MRGTGASTGLCAIKELDARNPLASTKGPFTQAQYGVTVGGPIIRGKTFAFGNFEQTRLNNAVVVTIQPASVAAINSILDQIGYTGERINTGNVPTGYDSTNFLTRIDHRLNESNLLAARYSLYDIASFNARGVGGLNAETRGPHLSIETRP